MGVDSKMLVQIKYSEDSSVIGVWPQKLLRGPSLTARLDKLPLLLYPQRKDSPFSSQWVPEQLISKIAQISPEIINLHWINGGFLQIESLARLRKPIVWTMHDMWPFTGGCHYSEGCNHYAESCGACPILRSDQGKDLSRWVWNRKSRAWEDIDITVVALSNWLADCARKSSLFGDRPIEIIPNCIDTTVYKPIDKKYARELLNLPQDKKIIGFGALRATSAPRKGFHLLLPSLGVVGDSNLGKNVELAVFGASQSKNGANLSLKTHYHGEINDEFTLAAFYSAVDVYVLPSSEDNLPNTVMEALACGTPCVAFSIGGVPDMIDHHENGYLCRPFDCQDLADGILWILENEERREALSKNARQKVLTTYEPRIVGNQYLNLYQKLVPQN